MEQPPRKFGSRNPWSRVNSSSKSSHAFGSGTSFEPSLSTYTPRPARSGPEPEWNTDNTDVLGDLFSEREGGSWRNNDANTPQLGDIQQILRTRQQADTPRNSYMLAQHQQPVLGYRTAEPVEMADADTRAIARITRPRTANEFRPSRPQAYSPALPPIRSQTPRNNSTSNPFLARSRSRTSLRNSPASAEPVQISPLLRKSPSVMRSFSEDSITPPYAAYSQRRAVTGSKAGDRRSYSQSMVSDLYGDETDTKYGADESSLEGAKYKSGLIGPRPVSTSQRDVPIRDRRRTRVTASEREVISDVIANGQPRSDPAIIEGDHKDFDKGSTLPIIYIDKLGVGASATVDIVTDASSLKKYAHKVFRPYAGRDESFKATFKNEIAIMKRLNPHPHIVQICWSYTRGRELGMLLAPVASDRDLATYLLAIHDTGKPPTEDQQRTLLQGFGCLANGLAYIHSHTIRHKDVKPHNVLVHNGQMIFTDFGIAFDASNQATTTTGMAETFTKRYCAPEVLQNLPRNRSSDVFSLGCVFLEILAVLLPSINVVLADPRPYCARVLDIRVNLTSLITQEAHDKAAVILSLCLDMIRTESAARIPAGAIQERLVPSGPWRIEQYFCSACLKGAPKSAHGRKYTGSYWNGPL